MSKTKLKLTSPEGELLQEYNSYREILREAYVAFDNSNELADGYSTAKYKSGARFTVTYWGKTDGCGRYARTSVRIQQEKRQGDCVRISSCAYRYHGCAEPRVSNYFCDWNF